MISALERMVRIASVATRRHADRVIRFRLGYCVRAFMELDYSFWATINEEISLYFFFFFFFFYFIRGHFVGELD